MNKIQITLTPQETTLLAVQGQALGYDVTKFVKFLVSREVYNLASKIPTYKMSESLEKETEKALKEYQAGKLRGYGSIDEMFANL
ncbi:MAG: hypothetical protein M1484_05210 [Patescibacteria group bacterium]|nr:hypothetical protein [Patescibacteria group bacterium]MCL5432453.1 hypothetical protein [Patescibacteria group bacterium]